MNKLKLNDLYPSASDKLDYKISTLVEIENNGFIENFSANTLLEKRKRKIKEKLKKYNKILNNCLMKISEYDDNNKTDIIYEIKHEIEYNKNFNYLECINFLQDNLRKRLFDTTIVSKRKIFVTWKYIEIKQEQDKTKSINLSKKSKHKI